MKNILLIGCAMLGLSLDAFAQGSGSLPTYTTFTSTNVTSTAVIVPQKPNGQPRLVSLIASSDLSSSTVTIYGGATAHYIATANTNNSGITNIVLESTNGLTTSSLIYMQLPGTNIVFTNNSIQTNGCGFASALPTNCPANAEVEILTTTPLTFGLGANQYKIFASDGLYVGPYGRALWILVNGTTYARIDSATVHYDQSSQ